MILYQALARDRLLRRNGLCIPSGVELPFPQAFVMRLSLWRGARCHLHIRRLHVFLRSGSAELLVGFCVGFLAVAGAVRDTLASDTWA